jgi:cytochrome c oxidase subunit 4
MANQHSDRGHGHGHAVDHPPSEQAHAAHAHPTWKTYVIVGAILMVITAVEVAAYYTPAWEASRIYVPSMLLLSTAKFIIVVMFYMHLKYDHKLFRALFTGPFIVAALTLIAFLFLFGQLAIRLGLLN